MKGKTFVTLVLVVCALLAFATPFVIDAFARGVDAVPVAVASMQADEPPVSPVELPVELQALLAAFIGYLVTQGLKSLSKLLNSDLSGWGAAITASVVTAVIYFFNAILSAVPVAAQPSVTIALMLLVSILGAFGVHATVKGKK